MLNFRIEIGLILIMLGLGLSSQAQHYNYPLDRYSRFFLLQNDTIHHGSFQGQMQSRYHVDTLKGFEPKVRYTKASQKLYDQHLIELHTKDLNASMDLLLHFEVGRESWEDNEYQDTTRMSRNMRGFIIRADIGNKISVSSSFREFQSYVPWYLFQYSQATEVMPGSGRVKAFNATGLDHNIAQGYVSYRPWEVLNLQFGTQRNFIGSGHRSLLLSDQGYAYPQIKASLYLMEGRLRYHVVHAWLQTLDRLPNGITPESLFIRKGGGFKYLEFAASDALSIGLFEGVVWNRFIPFEGNEAGNPLMYSPLIGTALASLGLADLQDNVVIGLDVSARVKPGLLLYGQYMLDAEDRDGFQLGLQSIDFGVDGLGVRLEYNSVAPFSYTNGSVRQGYNHFSEALSHPMGAGFDEVRASALYFKKRWFADISYVHATQLLDGLDSMGVLTTPGGNIFSRADISTREDLERYTATLDQVDVRVGRMFNPKSNFNAYLGYLYRDRRGAGERQGQSLLTFGIEMSLFNRNEDF